MPANPSLAVITWLDTAALCVLMGAAVARLWLYAPMLREAPRIAPRLSLIAGIALILLAANSVALLWLRTASMADVPLREAARFTAEVLQRTHYGELWWLRVTAIVLALIGWMARRSRYAGALWAVGVVGVAFSYSATGHAADAGDYSVREWLDTVHMLAAASWVGTILAYLVVQSTLRDTPALLTLGARRLSSAAWLSLDVVLFTGLYAATTELSGYWRTVLTDPYARVLGLKLALVAVMIGFGAVNRITVLRLDGDATRARRLRRNLSGELAVAVLVLAVVAVLVQTSPPAPVGHGH